jgi:hypothetical protein
MNRPERESASGKRPRAHSSPALPSSPRTRDRVVALRIARALLLIPVRATVGPKRLMFDSVAALTGIGVASGGFIALLISEHTPLVGFMEYGYRLEIVIALAAEAVAVVSLGVFLGHVRRRTRRLRPTAAAPEDAIGAARTPRANKA